MFSFERTGKGRFGFGFRIRISDSFLKDSIIFTSDSIRYDSHSIWTWFGLSMHRYRVQHCKAMKPQGGLGHDGRNFASQTFGFLLSFKKTNLHTSSCFIYLFVYLCMIHVSNTQERYDCYVPGQWKTPHLQMQPWGAGEKRNLLQIWEKMHAANSKLRRAVMHVQIENVSSVIENHNKCNLEEQAKKQPPPNLGEDACCKTQSCVVR